MVRYLGNMGSLLRSRTWYVTWATWGHCLAVVSGTLPGQRGVIAEK